MYVDPFLAGVVSTIFVELVLFVVVALVYGIRRKK